MEFGGRGARPPKGAAPRRFGMDTGSTGIVVAAEHYQPGPGDTNDGPGQLTYSSSGRVLHGTHYTTDVEILNDDDAPAATARVQVLRVERITCLRNARNCQPNEHPRGTAFMGVGFDPALAPGAFLLLPERRGRLQIVHQKFRGLERRLPVF